MALLSKDVSEGQKHGREVGLQFCDSLSLELIVNYVNKDEIKTLIKNGLSQ